MKTLLKITIVTVMALGGMLWAQSTPDEPGPKTVEDRLREYGEAARVRLAPAFKKAEISYPPKELVMVAIKDQKVLELYAARTNGTFQFVKEYPILKASGVTGPKLREGDKQVPEGIYDIEWLNPNSSYHLSMRIGYPNASDRAHAAEEGRVKLGGDIMIHGTNLSSGCLAMGDLVAEDLFVLVADTGRTNTRIILTPVDFRNGATVTLTTNLPPWTGALYQDIQTALKPYARP